MTKSRRILATFALLAAAVPAALFLSSPPTTVAARSLVRSEQGSVSLENRFQHLSDRVATLSIQVDALQDALAAEKQRPRSEVECALQQAAREGVQVRSFGFSLCPQGFIGKRKADRKLGPGENEVLFKPGELKKLLKDNRFDRISAAWFSIRRETETAVSTQPSAGWAAYLRVIENNRDSLQIELGNLPKDEFVVINVYVAYSQKPAAK